MTVEQMGAALREIGACFAMTSAKTILPNDGNDAKPSYHIHPDASFPHQDSIVRVYSQKQFIDYVRTKKAMARATSHEEGWALWQSYLDRWMK